MQLSASVRLVIRLIRTVSRHITFVIPVRRPFLLHQKPPVHSLCIIDFFAGVGTVSVVRKILQFFPIAVPVVGPKGKHRAGKSFPVIGVLLPDGQIPGDLWDMQLRGVAVYGVSAGMGPGEKAHILNPVSVPVYTAAPVPGNFHGNLHRNGFPGQLPVFKLLPADLKPEIGIRFLITFADRYLLGNLYLVIGDLFPVIIAVIALKIGLKRTSGNIGFPRL